VLDLLVARTAPLRLGATQTGTGLGRKGPCFRSVTGVVEAGEYGLAG
jgi:hypothetical protein